MSGSVKPTKWQQYILSCVRTIAFENFIFSFIFLLPVIMHIRCGRNYTHTQTMRIIHKLYAIDAYNVIHNVLRINKIIHKVCVLLKLYAIDVYNIIHNVLRIIEFIHKSV